MEKENQRLLEIALCSYLPYELKIKVGTKILELSTSHTTSKIHIEMVCKKSIYKPILRPLSDICKFINHNGEEMMLSLMGYEFPLENLISEEILKMEYNTINLLFELHFDVFGLIEKGLAIDINTLNK